MRKPRLVLASVAVLAAVAALGACSANKGGSGDTGATSKVQSGAIDADPAASRGPAKPVAGAVRGGTLRVLQEKDFEHLDPANVYTEDSEAVSRLISRTLTTFKPDPSGKLVLVGDLATGPGQDVNGDCKVWRYTLKDGLKYDDGTAITATDIGYAVGRSFSKSSPDISHGPSYFQQWLAGLDYNSVYQGPFNGGKPLPPGVSVQGTRQITFTFQQPECDTPYAAAWFTTSPVPKARDTGLGYDAAPVSSGPYKIGKYVRGTELDLVRNPNWDPRTDPVRHDYFDQLSVQIGVDDVAQSERLLASNGPDADAVAQTNVPSQLVPKVLGDAAVKKRTLIGYTPYVEYLNMDMQRITDLKERQAINYAFDRKGFLQPAGGSTYGDPATTIESPITLGYQKYDAYPAGASGDPAKAKQLLGGKHPKLVYAFPNTTLGQQQSTVVQQSLQRAGFTVVLRPLDKSNFHKMVADPRKNDYDIYPTAWGADWPSGYTIIPQLFDGRSLEHNPTWTMLNEKDVNDQIGKLSAQSATQAAPGWAKLDKTIMTKYAPVVPIDYQKDFRLMGSKVRGVGLSGMGGPLYFNTYLAR